MKVAVAAVTNFENVCPLLHSLITHHIVKFEFEDEKGGLQEFVLPAIISVFFWMVSLSYLVLSLAVMDEEDHANNTGEVGKRTSGGGGDTTAAAEAPPSNRGLYFNDQDLESARYSLNYSFQDSSMKNNQ